MGIKIWLDNNCVIFQRFEATVGEAEKTRQKERAAPNMYRQNAVKDNNRAWTQKQEPSVS